MGNKATHVNDRIQLGEIESSFFPAQDLGIQDLYGPHYKNCYPITIGGIKYVSKRPAIKRSFQIPYTGAENTHNRGAFILSWNNTRLLYGYLDIDNYIVISRVDFNFLNNYRLHYGQAFGSGGMTWGFYGLPVCEYKTSANIPTYTFIQSYSRLTYIRHIDMVGSHVTENAYSFPMCYGIVSMNGYLYVRNTDGIIYNSDIDDPVTIQATSKIVPSLYNDKAVALSRFENLIVALNYSSTEFFYDAGNPAPGSPLSPMRERALHTGCVHGGSVQYISNKLIWLARLKDGSKAVISYSGTVDILSNPSIINYLFFGTTADNMDVGSQIIYDNIGIFYVLTVEGRSIAYELNSSTWSIWTSELSNGNQGAVYTNGTARGSLGLYGITRNTEDNKLYITKQPEDGKYNEEYTGTTEKLINYEIYTPSIDFNTYHRKFIDNVTVVAEPTVNSTQVDIYYKDSYVNSSQWIGPRTTDIAQNKRPQNSRFASLRRYIFKIFNRSSGPCNISSLEVEATIGES